jgi:hypothetical protein
MSQPDAIIRIKNLRLRTFIGIKEEEIANRQDVVVNVAYPAEKSRNSEDINDALNYRTITKRIISHIENNRFSAGKINSGCARPHANITGSHMLKWRSINFMRCATPTRSP